MPRTALVALAAGLLLMFGPEFVLEPLSSEPWERSLLRYAGLFIPLAALFWPWAKRHGEEPGRRLRWWVAATLLFCLGYVGLQAPLFLVMAFCALVGSVADLGLARADLAADSLRARLDDEGRWGT